MIPPPPRSSLFPYTTLFRSSVVCDLILRPSPSGASLHYQSMPSATRAQRLAQLRYGEQQLNAIADQMLDRKSTRLNSSHVETSYAVFCLKKKRCTPASRRSP